MWRCSCQKKHGSASRRMRPFWHITPFTRSQNPCGPSRRPTHVLDKLEEHVGILAFRCQLILELWGHSPQMSSSSAAWKNAVVASATNRTQPWLSATASTIRFVIGKLLGVKRSRLQSCRALKSLTTCHSGRSLSTHRNLRTRNPFSSASNLGTTTWSLNSFIFFSSSNRPRSLASSRSKPPPAT